MARWNTVLVLCLIAGVALAVDDKTTSSTSTTTERTTTKETTEATTTPTTTAETTSTSTSTTAKTTSTSTTEKTTSTSTPSTTTTTTTAAPTTPTTVAPITTTTKPPVFPQNVNTWCLNETASNVTCVAFRAALEIKHGNGSISVPKTASVTGKCGLTNILFELSWEDEGLNKLSFVVVKKGKDSKETYGIEEATIVISSAPYHTEGNETLFETPVNASYKCVSQEVIKFENDTQLIISSLQMEAFSEKPFEKWSSARECKGDDVSAVVPVTVGAALIVLVVIVLVAYIIGRKRSRARGYQSV